MLRLERWNDAERDRLAGEMQSTLAAELPAPRRFSYVLHCRYVGQSFELPVAFRPGDTDREIAQRFHREHRRGNGYSREDEPVEVMTMQVTGMGGRVGQFMDTGGSWSGVPAKEGKGPASWSETTFSVHIARTWSWKLDSNANLLISRD
jgi:hypothetical protein